MNTKNMKRGRNQRRRQGTNPNRAFDSNGPDVRIRGTANQIFDKYQALARDASSAGDRVKAENYLQHAEHYFRVMRAMQPAPPPQEQPDLDGASPSAASADHEAPSRERQDAPSREREATNGGRRRGARAANGAETDSKNVTENEAALEGAPAVAKEDAPVNEGAAEAVDAKETEEERPRPRRKRRARPTKAEAAAAEESKEEATAG